MTAKHIQREELKKDEVVEGIQALVDDFQRNRTTILAVIGVIVLVIGIWEFRSRRAEAATAENTRIFRDVHTALASASAQPDAEKRKTDLQAAADSLQTLVDKRGSSRAGLHALFLQGVCYDAMDDYKRAAGTFDRFTALARTDEDRARGEIALGQSLESQSFLDEKPEGLSTALEHYERAATAAPSDSYIHFHALMQQGRVLELQGADDKALAIYKSVVEKREPPREAVPGAEKETERPHETGNPFMDSIFEQAREGAAGLSFRAQAQDRIDRLESAGTPASSPAGASS